MLSINVNGEPLDLTPGTQLEFVQENPFLQVGEEVAGDYSLPFEVRNTPNNMRLLGFPGLLQTKVANSGIEAGLFDGGLQHSAGRLKVEKASLNNNNMDKGGLSMYYLVGSSSFYQDIKDINMQAVNFGGDRTFSAAAFLTHINGVANGDVAADYAFFPMLNKRWDEKDRTVLMNRMKYVSGQVQFETLGTTMDGTNAIVPFPYLKYVLQRTFAHVGWQVKSDLFDDADFNKVVLLNFQAIDWSWMKHIVGGFSLPQVHATISFDLAFNMPNVTIAEFLIALKNRLCLWYDFDKKAKTVTITQMSRIVNGTVKDFSHKASPLMTKSVNQEPKVYALRNQFVGEYANGQPTLNPQTYQGKLDSKDDLPAASESLYGQYYLCVRENNYYICRQDQESGDIAWQLYAYNVYDYEPTGSNEEITTACTTVGNEYFDDYHYFIPRMDFQGQWPNFCDAEGDWNTILCFYHGKQATPGGLQIPFGSSGIYDMLGNQVAQWSLAFEHPTLDGGDAGLVERAWKAPLQIFNGNEELEVTLYLSKADYLNLHFSDVIHIRNVRLYLKQIKAVLPYRNVLTATCVRV